MNIMVNRAELLNAARRAAAIAPADSPLDVLKGTLLEADASAGTLTLTATNLEVALEEKLSCPAQESDALVVNARLLAGMLEKLSGDTVELRREAGQARVVLRSGTAVYTAPVWERGSFPKVEFPFPEDTVFLSGIPSMAKRTVFAAAQDGDKPVLKCVDLMFTQNGLQAVGSNGSCIVSAKGDQKSAGNISLLVPAASLDKLARLSRDQDEFRVGSTGNTIVFLKENFVFSARLMQGSYLDTAQVVNSIQNTFTVLTDVAELRNTLSSALCVEANGKVMLEFDGQALTFQCQGAYGNASASMDVIPLTGMPQGQYWYLAPQLTACLKALSGTVTLGVAQGWMLTLSTQDAFYMQIAMRPDADQPAKKSKKAA